jgi:hypothetical protein
MNLVFQLVGLAMLFGGIAIGYRYWINPYGNTIDFQAKSFLLLTVMTFIGGFIGAPAWWSDDSRAFAWDLPPLATRMLGSAAITFALATFLALQHPTYRAMRLVMLMLFVYLAPLTIVIVLFHMEYFDWDAPITPTFFIIVLTLVIGSTWYLFKQPTIIPDDENSQLPPSPLVQGWLGIVAALTGLWGLALFITDKGASDLIWVWPGDILSSRLIGVMLLTITTMALYALRSRQVAEITLASTALYGLGLAVASIWNTLADKPIKTSYVVVFGIIFIISTALLVLTRGVQSHRQPATA